MALQLRRNLAAAVMVAMGIFGSVKADEPHWKPSCLIFEQKQTIAHLQPFKYLNVPDPIWTT